MLAPYLSASGWRIDSAKHTGIEKGNELKSFVNDKSHGSTRFYELKVRSWGLEHIIIANPSNVVRVPTYSLVGGKFLNFKGIIIY